MQQLGKNNSKRKTLVKAPNLITKIEENETKEKSIKEIHKLNKQDSNISYFLSNSKSFLIPKKKNF